MDRCLEVDPRRRASTEELLKVSLLHSDIFVNPLYCHTD